ncbi:MAG TPA: hypothetical protein VM778_12750, partial [Gemmatimonadota bacterium]|nr:hypothetical protein [Gemmatimonadota bacterium]
GRTDRVPRRERPGPVPAMRLRLRWRSGEWELAGATRVEPAIPVPSARLPKSPDGDYAGFRIEIADKRGGVLYRRVLQDPTEQSVELFDRGRPRRVRSKRPVAIVDLLVPDLPGAKSVRIWGQQVSLEERVPAAVELARLSWPKAG